MSNETRPLIKDAAGRALPFDLPGFGGRAINDFAYLDLTEAEVAGIIAARHTAHLMQNRGMLGVEMAWQELKDDVCRLSSPTERDEWEELLGSEFSARTDEEIETLKAFAKLLKERTDYHAEWLKHCRPEIPAVSG